MCVLTYIPQAEHIDRSLDVVSILALRSQRKNLSLNDSESASISSIHDALLQSTDDSAKRTIWEGFLSQKGEYQSVSCTFISLSLCDVN